MNGSQNLRINESQTLHMHELRTLHMNELRTLNVNESWTLHAKWVPNSTYEWLTKSTCKWATKSTREWATNSMYEPVTQCIDGWVMNYTCEWITNSTCEWGTDSHSILIECVSRHIHTCDTSHSYAWHESFIRMSRWWYVCHDSFTCAPSPILIHVTYLYAWHDSFNEWQDSFIRVSNSFECVSCLIHMGHITHSHSNMDTYEWVMSNIWMRHVTHVINKTHPHSDVSTSSRSCADPRPQFLSFHWYHSLLPSPSTPSLASLGRWLARWPNCKKWTLISSSVQIGTLCLKLPERACGWCKLIQPGPMKRCPYPCDIAIKGIIPSTWRFCGTSG